MVISVIKFIIGIFGTLTIPGLLLTLIWLDHKISTIERIVFSISSSLGFLHLIMTTLLISNITITYYNVIILEASLTFFLLIYIIIKKKHIIRTVLFFKYSLKTHLLNLYPLNKIYILLALQIIAIFIYMFYHCIKYPVLSAGDTVSVYGVYSKYIYENGKWPYNNICVPQSLTEIRLITTLMSWIFLSANNISEAYSIIIVIISILTIITAMTLSYRMNKNKMSSIFAALVILSSPIYVYKSMCFHIDIPITYMFLITLYLIYLSIHHPEDKKIQYYSAFMLGITILSKLSGYIISYTIIFYILYIYYKEREIKKIISYLRIFIMSLIMSSILFVNNYIQYQNPLKVIIKGFNSFIPTKNLISDSTTYFTSSNTESLVIIYLHQLQKLMNLRTLNPYLEIPKIMVGRRENLFVIIICYIGFTMLLINARNDRGTLFHFITCTLYLFWWLNSRYAIRQLLPLLPLLAVYASSLMIIKNHDRNIFNIRSESKINFLKIFVILFLLIYPIIMQVYVYSRSDEISIPFQETGLSMALTGKIGAIKREDSGHLQVTTNAIEARWGALSKSWDYLNNNISADARILTDDRRIYYIEPCTILCTNSGINELYSISDICSILNHLYQYNITHIYYTGKASSNPLAKDMPIWNLLNKTHLFKLIYENGPKIYQIQWDEIKPYGISLPIIYKGENSIVWIYDNSSAILTSDYYRSAQSEFAFGPYIKLIIDDENKEPLIIYIHVRTLNDKGKLVFQEYDFSNATLQSYSKEDDVEINITIPSPDINTNIFLTKREDLFLLDISTPNTTPYIYINLDLTKHKYYNYSVKKDLIDDMYNQTESLEWKNNITITLDNDNNLTLEFKCDSEYLKIGSVKTYDSEKKIKQVGIVGKLDEIKLYLHYD